VGRWDYKALECSNAIGAATHLTNGQARPSDS